MASKVSILESAAEEHAAIVRYLLQVSDGPSAALRFQEEFDRQVGLIAENPLLYGLSHDSHLALRGWRRMPINNYLALYRVVGGSIEIGHIFHSRQDYSKLVM